MVVTKYSSILLISLIFLLRSPILDNPEFKNRRLRRKNKAESQLKNNEDSLFCLIKSSYKLFYNDRPKLQNLMLSVVYIWFWALILFLYRLKVTCIVLDIFTAIWSAIPFLIFIFYIFYISLDFVRFVHRKKIGKTPEIISGALILFLRKLDLENSYLEITFSSRERIAKEIYVIGNLMSELYSDKKERKPYYYLANNEMRRISKKYKKLSYYVVYLNCEKLDFVISVIIQFLNAFLKFNFNEVLEIELINSEVIQEKQKRVSSKIINFILLILYLLVPITIVMMMDLLFSFEFSPVMQSISSFFYVVWVMLGLNFFMDKTNKDSLISNWEFIKSLLNIL